MESQRKVKEQSAPLTTGTGIIQYVKMIDVKMIVVIDPENSKKFARHSGPDRGIHVSETRFIKYAVGDGCAGNSTAVSIIAPGKSYHSLRPSCSSPPVRQLNREDTASWSSKPIRSRNDWGPMDDI